LIAWCFPSFLLTLLYGSGFGEYAFVLRWFSVIYIFAFLSMPLNIGLRAIEITMPLFYSLFYVSIFSIVAAYPLVTSHGLNGAMFGMLITKVGVVVIMFFSLRFHISNLKPEI